MGLSILDIVSTKAQSVRTFLRNPATFLFITAPDKSVNFDRVLRCFDKFLLSRIERFSHIMQLKPTLHRFITPGTCHVGIDSFFSLGRADPSRVITLPNHHLIVVVVLRNTSCLLMVAFLRGHPSCLVKLAAKGVVHTFTSSQGLI